MMCRKIFTAVKASKPCRMSRWPRRAWDGDHVLSTLGILIFCQKPFRDGDHLKIVMKSFAVATAAVSGATIAAFCPSPPKRREHPELQESRYNKGPNRDVCPLQPIRKEAGDSRVAICGRDRFLECHLG